MRPPPTQYAKSGDVHVAFQVAGDADIDLVIAPGTVSHLDLDWDLNRTAFDRLLTFCRLIRFDKRGTGMSDRVAGVASLEDRTDDIRAVMDAVHSERAAILGISEGGSMSMLFAATYPERTRCLIVWAGQPRYVWAPDMPWGIPRAEYERVIEDLEANGVTEDYIRGWGAGYGYEVPSDELEQEFRIMQAGASPAAIAALERMNMEIDIRDIVPNIRVPTLIVNASHDPISPIEGARYLAERIPNARLVEYDGKTHGPESPEQEAWLIDEIEEFVTGARPPPGADRLLTTILFTDIVGSTELAARLGDAEWVRLLGAHDDLARAEFGRFGGVEVDHAGDGFLVRFDGPARAIRCAQAVREKVEELGLTIRAGLHSGEVEVTAGGVKGVAVHIGARVSALAGGGDILVSSTVRDLVLGSGLAFEDVGVRKLKGVDDRWHLYRVIGE